MPGEDVDALIWLAKTSSQYLDHVAAALAAYKTTNKLPEDLVAMVGAAVAAAPKKRGPKKGKLNKDGTEKQPRKPTAYNAWMQSKLKELKAATDHDPNEKHVDTFKQAAHIWASMDPDEKKRITDEFKEKMSHADGSNGTEAAGEAETSEGTSSDDDSDEEEPAAVAKPAPVPAPKPSPVPAPTASLATPEKKKKKRKPESVPATPISPPAVPISPDGEKKKKKKKKAAADE